MQRHELNVHFPSPKIPQYLLSNIPKPYQHNFCCSVFDTKYNVPDRDISKSHYVLLNAAQNILKLFLI